MCPLDLSPTFGEGCKGSRLSADQPDVQSGFVVALVDGFSKLLPLGGERGWGRYSRQEDRVKTASNKVIKSPSLRI